jgi:flagellar biosynthesis protein FlhA
MLVLEPDEQTSLLDGLRAETERATAKGYQAVVICGSQMRLPLKRFIERHVPGLSVLAYSEVSEAAEVEFVGQVRVA